MATIYFLRHAEPILDPTLHPTKWILNSNGVKQASDLAQTGILDNVKYIFSSDEKKAYQTAEPFAKRLNLEIERNVELNELNRGDAFIMNGGAYKQIVQTALSTCNESVLGWEAAEHALSRFIRAIAEIESEHSSNELLVVSHGMVLSLYFANLLNLLDRVFSRWKKIRMCSWGIVENGFVKKDIV